MAGTTPLRGYPFPQDPDLIDVAGDIERLARAVDTDAAAIYNHSVGVGQRITRSIPSVGIAAGNIIGLVEIGTFAIPNDVIDRTWHFWWYFGCTNHNNPGTVRQLISNNAGTYVAVGLHDSFVAQMPMSCMMTGRLGHPANSGDVLYHCWAEITGSGANTNINGGIAFIGV